ncbi:MAG: phosphate regulon sensor protein PhoR, partial [Gammaproteobacteria bacterium]|nr:phosphate regulon sensor protein PhoR [Gammaproteobacteria bacterium]
MKLDLLRFSVVLLISAVAGIISDHFVACMAIGMFVFLVWFFYRLDDLLTYLRQRDGREENEFSGVCEDILIENDRVRSHYLDRARQMLVHLKRFQIATTAIPDAVVLLGEYGRIDWANDKAREYLGIHWPRDQGYRITNLLRDPRLMGMLENFHSVDTDDRLELALLLNKERYLEFRMVPYGEDQNLLVARDVTDIHKASEMRKDFIANASHELRTPLTVIAGYLESLQNEPEDTPVSARAGIIGKMRNHTVRMQRLIDDLL